MAVKHAEEKKRVLSEIQKLMDKMSGGRLAPKHDSAGPLEGEDSEPEETDDSTVHHEPTAPHFSWTDGPEAGEGAGDEEDAPSDEELDAMEAKLKKHGRR